MSWPKGVEDSNGRMIYRPVIPVADRSKIATDNRGRLKPPIFLGKRGDSEAAILRAYLAAVEEIQVMLGGSVRFSLHWLDEQYSKSERFRSLSVKSQANIGFMRRLLDHKIKVSGAAGLFGDLQASALTPPMLRSLFDRRLQIYRDAGKKGSAIVNRERAYLSAMLSWGIEHIDGLGLATNPCKGIRGAKETPRSRYVTEDDYQIQSDMAREIADYLPVVFELAYLCAARGSEIVALRRDSIRDEGLVIRRGKGSRDNIIKWSTRLRQAVAAATRGHSNLHLIVNTQDQPLNKHALDTAMQRLKAKMEESGHGAQWWTLHDLKRKGLTDAADKTIAGHRTEAMRQRYNVGLDQVDPPA